MSPDSIVAFCLFAFVASITPGPNNLMLLASGMNYGFRASIPHMMGVGFGFFVMLVAVGSGLSQVFVRYPLTYSVMKWLGASYLLYLAWGMATSGEPFHSRPNGEGRPMRFLGAAAFQWVNPKAWVMAVGAFSIYVPTAPSYLLISMVSTIFTAINVPCLSAWVLFGTSLRKFLHVPTYRRIFNVSMAVALVASLAPLIAS